MGLTGSLCALELGGQLQPEGCVRHTEGEPGVEVSVLENPQASVTFGGCQAWSSHGKKLIMSLQVSKADRIGVGELGPLLWGN